MRDARKHGGGVNTGFASIASIRQKYNNVASTYASFSSPGSGHRETRFR